MPDVVGGEGVLKRLQGIKDSRGPVGQFARGNNMYPGGAQARTGGGPDIGRPPEAPSTAVPAAAMQAVTDRMQANLVPPVPTVQPNALPQLEQKLMGNQASLVNANPKAENAAARFRLNKSILNAAQRRLKRG